LLPSGPDGRKFPGIFEHVALSVKIAAPVNENFDLRIEPVNQISPVLIVGVHWTGRGGFQNKLCRIDRMMPFVKMGSKNFLSPPTARGQDNENNDRTISYSG